MYDKPLDTPISGNRSLAPPISGNRFAKQTASNPFSRWLQSALTMRYRTNHDKKPSGRPAFHRNAEAVLLHTCQSVRSRRPCVVLSCNPLNCICALQYLSHDLTLFERSQLFRGLRRVATESQGEGLLGIRNLGVILGKGNHIDLKLCCHSCLCSFALPTILEEVFMFGFLEKPFYPIGWPVS